VKVRTGCKTGLTYKTDELALLHRAPGPNPRRNARQVRVTAGHSTGMLDSNQISVSAVPAGKCHDAIRNRNDRTARG
jgi:hypothetical protein